jgi:hypothetical protein
VSNSPPKPGLFCFAFLSSLARRRLEGGFLLIPFAFLILPPIAGAVRHPADSSGGELEPPVQLRLFSDENEDSGGKGHNVEQENGWPDIQAEPQ